MESTVRNIMCKSSRKLIIGLILVFTFTTRVHSGFIEFSPKDISFEKHNKAHVTLRLSEPNRNNLTINFYVDHNKVLILPSLPDWQLLIPATDNNITEYEIDLQAIHLGHVDLSANTSDPQFNGTTDCFTRVTVKLSEALEIISLVVGWTYFAIWTACFYPQTISNFRRKSVVGFHFDYATMNFTGHLMYALFNSGLYWFAVVQNEYFRRHPRGINPVQANDVWFSIHATAIGIVLVAQCFIYEGGGQKVSTLCKILLISIAIWVVASLGLSIFEVFKWLDFLYYLSIIKLVLTVVKYSPQVYFNYSRKSTAGWAIGSVCLDFGGGVLSMLQMILISWNYDDWISIFGDPTKFGLGFLSSVYNLTFMIQHFVLYKHGNDKEDELVKMEQNKMPMITVDDHIKNGYQVDPIKNGFHPENYANGKCKC